MSLAAALLICGVASTVYAHDSALEAAAICMSGCANSIGTGLANLKKIDEANIERVKGDASNRRIRINDRLVLVDAVANSSKPRWTQDRVAAVKSLISKLESLYPNFLERAYKNGLKTIEIASMNEIGATAQVRPSEGNRLTLSEVAFNPPLGSRWAPDVVKQGRFNDFERILIHEIAHVVDSRPQPLSVDDFEAQNQFKQQSLAYSPGFLSAAAWSYPAGVTRFEYVENTRSSAKNRKELDELKLSSRLAREPAEVRIAREREFSKSHGMPSLYAFVESKPEESFAEFATFAIIDETAPTYMSPQMLAWLHKNVLD
ncbi:MAG: hypothetical protein EOP06_20030 [Proteobacteria bacterium]|nr:MAG: hypothetical protein EOP06_20030 [Pseudomonadota bacterium]